MDLFKLGTYLIESLLMVYFIFHHYQWKLNKDYYIVSAILFIEEVIIREYITNVCLYDIFLLSIMIVTMALYQYFRVHSFQSAQVFLSIVAICNILFGNVIVILCFYSLHIDIIDNFMMGLYISKLISFLVVYFYYPKEQIKDNDLAKIWVLDIVALMLMLLIVLDIHHIVIYNINKIMLYLHMAAMMIVLILIGLIVERFMLSSVEQIHYEKMIQKNKYDKINYKLLQQNNIEIVSLQHNLKYILLSILLSAKNGDLEAITEQANMYLGKVKKTCHCILTNNPYFDYRINQVSQEFKHEEVILKKDITIPENSLMNKGENTDKVIYLIRKMLLLAKVHGIHDIEVRLNEEDNWCLVMFIMPYRDRQKIEEYLNETFEIVRYKIFFDENHCVFRLSRILEYYQK